MPTLKRACLFAGLTIYIYTGDYEDEPSSLITNDGIIDLDKQHAKSSDALTDTYELLRDPRVYFLADSFFLENLKAVALEKFRVKLDEL